MPAAFFTSLVQDALDTTTLCPCCRHAAAAHMQLHSPGTLGFQATLQP